MSTLAVTEKKVKPVIVYLCVVREKTLTGAELKEIKLVFSDDVNLYERQAVGLQAFFENKQPKLSCLLGDVAGHLKVDYMRPSEWAEAEMFEVALSDVIPIEITSEKSTKLFDTLVDLHDNGGEDDGSKRFDALISEVEIVRNAVTSYGVEGNSFVDMQKEIIQKIMTAMTAIPRMIIIGVPF